MSDEPKNVCEICEDPTCEGHDPCRKCEGTGVEL